MRHLLIATTILIFIFSCGKPNESIPNGARFQERCPAFDPKDISTWMPYGLHKTYYYFDSSGVKYTLTVDSQDFSEEYWVTLVNSCVVTGDVYAFADTANPFDIGLNISYGIHSQDPGGPNLCINWMGAVVYFSYSGYAADTLRPKQPTTNNSLSVKGKMSFGGKDYYTVHELTVKHEKIQKLYIVKGHGVVAFTTVDNTTYWLIE